MQREVFLATNLDNFQIDELDTTIALLEYCNHLLFLFKLP